MSNGSGNGHDHPGSYKLIEFATASTDALTALFDASEADGYKFVDMNDEIAVFYKEGRR